MATTEQPGSPNGPLFPLRTVVVGTFVPTVLFETGVGALLPIIAATATSLGASLELAGFVLALIPVGQLLLDVPAGIVAARFGDRRAMFWAGLFAAAACVAAALAPSLLVFALSILAIGGASSVYFLARQSYLTEITHPLRRARVLSTSGGVHRIGLFLGPFLGAGIIGVWGLAAVYWAAGILALTSVLVIALAGPDGVTRASPARPVGGNVRPVSIVRVFREHRRVLATLGMTVLLVGAVRGARTTVLPLWAEHIGIDPAVTSVVFGVAAAVDALLFYPAGWVMDRYGRLAVGVPAMIGMGVGLLILPFMGSLAGITVAAIVLGLGNGMSSGILMTLGADVAPPEARSQFLALWRVLSDLGMVSGPLVLSLAAALGSLAAGVWVMAGSSVASVAAQLRWVPQHTVHASNRTRRAAGLIE
ncbi:MAG TPA: MFS transporter [Actinomycetales bacterium]|nr:MFS transporter [Actinomycetales bacterium]